MQIFHNLIIGNLIKPVYLPIQKNCVITIIINTLLVLQILCLHLELYHHVEYRK
jgi:hypothetical protein